MSLVKKTELMNNEEVMLITEKIDHMDSFAYFCTIISKVGGSNSS